MPNKSGAVWLARVGTDDKPSRQNGYRSGPKSQAAIARPTEAKHTGNRDFIPERQSEDGRLAESPRSVPEQNAITAAQVDDPYGDTREAGNPPGSALVMRVEIRISGEQARKLHQKFTRGNKERC